MNRLLLFYLGSHPDHRGRMLSEILVQDDHWLEYTHDYIQWLFPTREFSRVTPDAPVVSPEIERIFQQDELLTDHLRASFNRMLAFYGLVHSGDEIRKSSRWAERKDNWFIQDTHNNLRLTRIINSLKTLGMPDDAKRLYLCLNNLKKEADCGIGATAYRYWRNAAARVDE